MTFKHSCYGYIDYRDVDEYNCNIFLATDEFVGYCKYYKPTCERAVYIEYINIKDLYKRRGYATEMVRELMKKYDLRWDYKFTDDGHAWYNNLVKTGIVR